MPQVLVMFELFSIFCVHNFIIGKNYEKTKIQDGQLFGMNNQRQRRQNPHPAVLSYLGLTLNKS